MKRVLYIGINSGGSTSKMRADILKNLLSEWEFNLIDTDTPKKYCNRIWQSIGFRYKRGPVIGRVNKYVLERLNGHYDLIWVDKAIYLTAKTTAILKEHTDKLVHFSPDPAFTFHRSHHFFKSLPLYDFAVTTKSYEVSAYADLIGERKVLYATQGFDKSLHCPVCDFTDKRGVSFIGHYEKEREKLLQLLIDQGVEVILYAPGWENFHKRNEGKPNFIHKGAVFGDDYVRAISSSLISWGSLSKWIPEKHTTRTFEIPACGTALLSERNAETSEFFNDDEAILYDTEEEAVEKVLELIANPNELETISAKGLQRVNVDGRDYESILHRILVQIGIL